MDYSFGILRTAMVQTNNNSDAENLWISPHRIPFLSPLNPTAGPLALLFPSPIPSSPKVQSRVHPRKRDAVPKKVDPTGGPTG